MAATFDPTLATQKDHIRLALGDRHNNAVVGDVSDPLLTDELINSMISNYGYLDALAELALALVAEWSQRPDEMSEDGNIRMKWTQRIAAWQDVAQRAKDGQIPIPGAEASVGRRAHIEVAQLTVQRTLTSSGSGFRAD